MNPDLAYDCGKPRGPIWKVAWSGVKNKWPGAHAVVKAFHINNTEMGGMVADVDLDRQDLDKVVEKWMAKNKSRWMSWIGK